MNSFHTTTVTAPTSMPTSAPLPKLVATKAYGATVHLEGQSVDDALDAAGRFAEQTGAVLIHPFDHEDIVAGQATVALEILEQVPAVGTIVVPTGGGGLLAGIAAATHVLAPHVRVVGVQAASAAACPSCLKSVQCSGTLMAGLPVMFASCVYGTQPRLRRTRSSTIPVAANSFPAWSLFTSRPAYCSGRAVTVAPIGSGSVASVGVRKKSYSSWNVAKDWT